MISALAGLTELAVQFLGDGLVGVTQALARVVAHLTGSGVIAPTDPPLPAPPAGQRNMLWIKLLYGFSCRFTGIHIRWCVFFHTLPEVTFCIDDMFDHRFRARHFEDFGFMSTNQHTNMCCSFTCHC